MSVAWRASGNTKLCEVYATNGGPIMSSPATVHEAYHSSFNKAVFKTTFLQAEIEIAKPTFQPYGCDA